MAQVLIVQSMENPDVAQKLFNSAIGVLDTSLVSYDKIEVPSINEIPTAISMSLESSDFEAVIALGCLIENKKESLIQPISFHVICESLNDFGVHYIMPIGNGLIFTKNEKDAAKLAETYGQRSAMVAVQMLKYKRQINLLEDDRLTHGRKHN